jgi:hypothetical protein
MLSFVYNFFSRYRHISKAVWIKAEVRNPCIKRTKFSTLWNADEPKTKRANNMKEWLKKAVSESFFIS